MTTNSGLIIQQIQEEVRKLIGLVTGAEGQSVTAYEMEKQLFKELLKIGASLLLLYLQTKAMSLKKEKMMYKEREIKYHSEKGRQLLTIFGEIRIERPYYYESGQGYSPLEEAVNWPVGSKYSDMVRELSSQLVVHMPYREGQRFLCKLLNIPISTRAVQEMVIELGEGVEGWYEQQKAPEASREGEILVVQGDGKAIPLDVGTATAQAIRTKRGQARSRKKEVVVGTAYTQQASPRTVKEVLNSFFQQEEVTHPHHQPLNKKSWATLKSKAEALTYLRQQVVPRCQPTLTAKVALCDGAPALQKQFQTLFPDFTLVLDFIHATEYVWKAANALFTEDDPQRTTWVIQQTTLLLEGQVLALIAQWQLLAQQTPSASSTLLSVCAYFERNAPYMIYDHCLLQGWPIASGVIEADCRHLVKERFELSGMRWTPVGAEALLHLRCLYSNGDWDSYFHFSRLNRYSHPSSLSQPLPLAI